MGKKKTFFILGKKKFSKIKKKRKNSQFWSFKQLGRTVVEKLSKFQKKGFLPT